ILVPLLGALAALVVAAGAFVVLRGGGEQFGSPHATYRDSLTPPHPAAPTPPQRSDEQAKIDEQARALGLGSGHPRAVEPQPRGGGGGNRRGPPPAARGAAGG